MSCLNIQARKCWRIRLKAAETCLMPSRRCYHPPRLPDRDVYTLDPAKFVERHQDWVDLSSISHPTIHIFNEERVRRPVQLAYAMKPLKTDSGDVRGLRDSWPHYSRGFLYYFCPPNRPRIAGELRLRLTPTDDASTFHQGKDLCVTQPNPVGAVGHPWRRPLYSIAKHLNSRPLYERLVEEGLVSPELDKSIQSLPKITFMYSRCQIIYSIHDTFVLDLASDWITLVAISETGIAKIRILRQFRDLRIDAFPYSGTVLAQFEPSALRKHADTRTVVLRVVQELTPVRCLISSYDGYIERPRRHHLFAKQFHGKLRPWSIDIDSPAKGKLLTTGLKLLWDSTFGWKRGSR